MPAENLVGLDELTRTGDSAETTLTVFIGNNLGHQTLQAKLPIFQFHNMSNVANERGQNGEAVAQRKLDPNHAKGLALYTLKGLLSAVIRKREAAGYDVTEAHRQIEKILGHQPYMALQPITANLRTAGPAGKDLRFKPLKHDSGDVIGFRLWLSQRDILWIVDGQHRRKGLDLVFDFLNHVHLNHKYPPKKQSLYAYTQDDREVPADELNVWQECLEVARGDCTVQLEIHLGLSVEEERQLFHDLNRLAKKVEASLAYEFDGANPINAFIKSYLIDTGRIAITNKDIANWNDDTGEMSRKDLVAVNAHLFLNKSNISGAIPALTNPRIEIAQRFWEAILTIPGFGEEGAKRKTVAAQPVVLKALAKLVYDFAFGRNADDDLLDRLLDGITEIDFSHVNPMWRYYELSDDGRSSTDLDGLIDYLPPADAGRNFDIGKFDQTHEWIRFGAKHTDIYPILGDMIRWTLGLPSRHADAPAEV